MNWLEISSDAFIVAFFLYIFSFVAYCIAFVGRKWSNRDPQQHVRRWGKIGFIIAMAGLAANLVYFFTRWAGAHFPTSNMYEFMAFLGMAIMIAFTVVYAIYRKELLGLFALPLTIIIIAYASVFPQEVQPLIPALNSIWLKVHVSMAALGEAFFAVGFAAGLMYLLRTIDFKDKSKQGKRSQRWVEFALLTLVVTVAFIVTVFAFRAADYTASFEQVTISINGQGVETVREETVEYQLPPIVKPYNSTVIEMTPFLGIKEPVFESFSWMEGVNAARKFNTVLWSVINGILLYAILRLIARKPLAAVIHPMLDGIDPEDLDEISYRAIAIGFPIFTLGALIFAMIWAQIAWSRFWGWDPKEVWALITWLYYSAYLHLRLSRGWQGTRSAWLAVIGFIVVWFTLVGVNLIIAGLHSYAGA